MFAEGWALAYRLFSHAYVAVESGRTGDKTRSLARRSRTAVGLVQGQASCGTRATTQQESGGAIIKTLPSCGRKIPDSQVRQTAGGRDRPCPGSLKAACSATRNARPRDTFQISPDSDPIGFAAESPISTVNSTAVFEEGEQCLEEHVDSG